MSKRRRSSMQQAMLNMNKHIYSSEVRLMMECTEEELLPCQKSSYKSALDEYSRVNKYIADVQTGKIQMSNVPNSTISLVTDPNAVVRPKQASKTNNDPDVIVIGESPAQQTKGGHIIPALPNLNNIALPALPDNTGQQIITFPQQVYNQFVNGQQSNVVKVGNQIFIRPIMPVAPQQNGAQGVSYSVNNQSMVRPTSLLKRQADIEADKKRLLASKNEMDSSGNWVPLDEFYYGKKEGDPTYVEDKGEYRFKCWYCSKMLYNNVKIMMHMQGHIDSEKQHNLDLSDLTQCKHCYKQFDTPFEMQTHIEKVHMYNSNVLMCRICEKDCDSRFTLTSHMRTNHNACEMPYICHLCGFRSSMYSDVVDHFKKKHDSSANLLCLYCLKAFNIKFISTGWGQTQNYYHHLLKHQAKNKVKKCQVCKLTFFNTGELKVHRQKDHLANVKGVIGMNSKYTTPDQVMIKVPEQGLQPKAIKSLNAPTVSKVRDNHLLLPRVVNDVDCLECKTSMSSVEHFKKYIQCSMCRFATSCSFAYANHMMGFHSGKMTTLSLNIPQEKPMEHVMYCMCGYASLYGNKIANHMVHCTKRTCYKDKPDVQIQEYDNKEMQDPRKKPGASLLDVLGLVKKPSSGEGDDINEDVEGSDDKLKEDSSSNVSRGRKSSTRAASEVKEKSDNDNDDDDVVEIIDDEPAANNETNKNSAKSNEEKTISNKDDGGGEDMICENSVSSATDNIKNNTEDITESINDAISPKDSQKDNESEIKESEFPNLNDEQSGSSNDITEVKAVEKKSDDQSIADDPEVQMMEIPADQSTSEDKDSPVIESKTLDFPVPVERSAEERKPESDSETIDQKTATSPTPISDDKESTLEELKDMPDAVIPMETEDAPSSDNVDTTDKETESSTRAEEKSLDDVNTTSSTTDKEAGSSSIAEDKDSESSSIAEDKETESSSIAKDKEIESSSIAEDKETESSSIAEDKEIESSSMAEDKSTEETLESKEISQSEVPLNEASTHSSGTTADKEKNITPTTDQTNTKTSSYDEPMDQKSTEPEVTHVTPDKPFINEASLETNPEEESSKKSLIKNIEKDTTQVESAIQSSEEQPSKETCPGTTSDQQPDEDPTKRQEQSESSSSSQQPNNPPQQQNQKDTSAESSSKPDNSNRRNADGQRRYSDEHSRAYDRDRSNREHRDRDRSHQHRNDYRDRSRDYHSDRDRKYDRDYDRHDRDRNRGYGYHGSHSRDNRRDGYRERDRDRDYDNRNYNRKGGNYRDRSGYY